MNWLADILAVAVLILGFLWVIFNLAEAEIKRQRPTTPVDHPETLTVGFNGASGLENADWGQKE